MRGRRLGRLPERFEASMSAVSPPESRSAAFAAPRDPPVVGVPPTPLFTRHTGGAIEAERARAGSSRVRSAFTGAQAPRSIEDRIDRIGRSTSRKVEMLIRASLCAACALLVSATPAHATFPGQNGKIAFTSFDDLQSDIYTMTPTGRHLLNLTPFSPAADEVPSWSPNGRKITFYSTRTGPTNPTGDQEIYVMNADGSGMRQVTFNTVDDGAPSWSPDGDRLV